MFLRYLFKNMLLIDIQKQVEQENSKQVSWARTVLQWYYNDNKSLIKIKLKDIYQHQDRKYLALILTSTYQKFNQYDKVKEFSYLAIKWGCPKEYILQIMFDHIKNIRDFYKYKFQFDKNCSVISNMINNYSTLIFYLRSLSAYLINWQQLAEIQRHKQLVSIIIPVYNQLELTEKCIKSVFNHSLTLHCEVIIVDNGSNQQMQNKLRELQQRFKTLIVLRQQENLNFALGCNIGFAASHGSSVVFLNNDTEVTKGWLEYIIKPLENTSIVAVQPKLLYPNGSIQCVGVVFSEKSVLGYPIYEKMKLEDNLVLKSRSYQAVTGACIALRADDFIRVKGFDLLFINGQEDIDLCLRLTEKSSNSYCWYASDALVYHHESQTKGRFKYSKKNRGLFIVRWKAHIQPDAQKYYQQDGFQVIEWVLDYKEHLKEGIAIYRPKIKRCTYKSLEFKS